MNIPLANAITADMVNRLVHADDFFTTANEFDYYLESRDEYIYGMKAAIAKRVPFEGDMWRIEAIQWLQTKMDT